MRTRAIPTGRTALTAAIVALLLPAGAGPRAGDADPLGVADAMLQRPLFSPTRRPPPPPAAPLPPLAPAPAAPAMPDLALSGIIAGGGSGIALLRRAVDPAPVRVRLGGEVDGWTVAEIRPRAVVLRRDARSVTVELPTP